MLADIEMPGGANSLPLNRCGSGADINGSIGIVKAIGDKMLRGLKNKLNTTMDALHAQNDLHRPPWVATFRPVN
jgi:hypothetical protein